MFAAAPRSEKKTTSFRDALFIIVKFLTEFKRLDKIDGIMFCGESVRCQAFVAPVDGSSASIKYHRYRNISLHGRRRRLLAQRFLFEKREGSMLFTAQVNL